jgi:hypothetical protein
MKDVQVCQINIFLPVLSNSPNLSEAFLCLCPLSSRHSSMSISKRNPNIPKVTAYLDTTCSMPTSEALSTKNSPCYFVSTADQIGSFKAKCSSSRATTNNNNNATTTTDGTDDHHSGRTTSPGLQSTHTNGARALSPPALVVEGSGLVELGIRGLMAMGAIEAVWGWA